jgi:PAS domain S-box-containing protein
VSEQRANSAELTGVLESVKQVLEMVASGALLGDVLAAVTSFVERQSPGDLCSVLLLSRDGRHLHSAAGPSLPPQYAAAIDGSEIGPAAGSCGTAAFTRLRVVVSDIATDPRWAPYKEVALAHGLRACWSQPVLSRDGRRVLGTVAHYRMSPGEPSPDSLRLLETATHLAQIAIEQSAAEEKLRRQSLAFDNLYDGIVLTDERGRITAWNRAAERMFGYSRQEAVGSEVAALLGRGGAVTVESIFGALNREGRWRGEVTFVRKDGSRGVCEKIVVPLKDRRGRMIATVGVNHDITERKRAEAHLLTEAAVTRVLATSGSVAEAIPRLLEAVCTACGWETGVFWRLDEAMQVMRCEEFWREPSLDVAEFERATLGSAFPPGVGLPGRVWAAARAAWITDVRHDANFPRKGVAGDAGFRGALGVPVLLAGRVIGVMEFFTRSAVFPDGQLDAMLTVLGGQVGQFIDRMTAAGELRAAKESAERANRAKDRFLAMLSHELRTPLSPALLIATAMAADESLPRGVRGDAATIRKNIQLQTRLIDDLLDLSRIENGKLVLVPETLDLHELLRDCVKVCEGDAAAKSIRVSCELSAGCHMLSGDPSRLRQVVCNVLKNAVKFTPAGGAVRVASADVGEQRVTVSVTDSGIGADATALGKLFNAFEQAGRDRESQGLGLGLAICKGLVEAHGGSIAASSPGIGRGMTVTIELPALPASEPAPAARPAPEAAVPAAPLRILLVDDHADTLRAMSRLLRQLEHRVITADCVSSALSAAESNDFDLLISDVGLPDGTGTGLMRELLKRRPVKGIALTGYGMESDIQQTREAGFFAHLTKPIDFNQLQEAIRQGTAGSAP